MYIIKIRANNKKSIVGVCTSNYVPLVILTLSLAHTSALT